MCVVEATVPMMDVVGLAVGVVEIPEGVVWVAMMAVVATASGWAWWRHQWVSWR